MTQLENILERLGGEKRIHLGLERFQSALNSLGNPVLSAHTIVIGGTNGKGSTTLYVSSALKEAGYKVATYLSPHLQCPTERFLLNLNAISYEELESLALELEPTATKFELTYFEFLSLIYFVWASREKVDFSITEVGLGGRLDATNVGNPIASVITNISLDHEKFLGNTKEAILNEKLGIIRSEGLVFSGLKDAELRTQLIDACNNVDAIYYFSEDLRSEANKSINGYPFEVLNPSPANWDNVKLAFLVMRIVFPKIPISTLQTSFKAVKNPGRMELIQSTPKVYLSGDHNEEGMESLIQTIEKMEIKNPRIVCAFSPDKPYAKMLQLLSKVSSRVTLTTVSRLKGSLPKEYFTAADYIENPIQAVKEAMSTLTSQDTLIITGSLYLVGEVRSLWKDKATFLC